MTEVKQKYSTTQVYFLLSEYYQLLLEPGIQIFCDRRVKLIQLCKLNEHPCAGLWATPELWGCCGAGSIPPDQNKTCTACSVWARRNTKGSTGNWFVAPNAACIPGSLCCGPCWAQPMCHGKYTSYCPWGSHAQGALVLAHASYST